MTTAPTSRMANTQSAFPRGDGAVAATAPSPRGNALWVFAMRLVGAVVIPIAAFYALWVTFDFLRDSEANRVIVVGVAVVVGVGGIFFLYWAMNRAVELLPERYREGVRPWIFVGPAMVLLSVFLVYPVINTILISFKDAQSQKFVGL